MLSRDGLAAVTISDATSDEITVYVINCFTNLGSFNFSFNFFNIFEVMHTILSTAASKLPLFSLASNTLLTPFKKHTVTLFNRAITSVPSLPFSD